MLPVCQGHNYWKHPRNCPWRKNSAVGLVQRIHRCQLSSLAVAYRKILPMLSMYQATGVSARSCPSAEQHSVLDLISKLFCIPSSWSWRAGNLFPRPDLSHKIKCGLFSDEHVGFLQPRPQQC